MSELMTHPHVERAFATLSDDAQHFAEAFAASPRYKQDELPLTFTDAQESGIHWHRDMLETIRQKFSDRVVYSGDDLYWDVAVHATEKGLKGGVWYTEENPRDIRMSAVDIVENDGTAALLSIKSELGLNGPYALEESDIVRLVKTFYTLGSLERLDGSVISRYEHYVSDQEEAEALAINPARVKDEDLHGNREVEDDEDDDENYYDQQDDWEDDDAPADYLEEAFASLKPEDLTANIVVAKAMYMAGVSQPHSKSPEYQTLLTVAQDLIDNDSRMTEGE